MTRGVLHSLLRKKPVARPKAARDARLADRISRGALIERRDLCMREIVRLRSDADPSGNLANKARQLLTARWAAASWRARADILRSAEWLLGISRNAAATMPNAEQIDRSAP